MFALSWLLVTDGRVFHSGRGMKLWGRLWLVGSAKKLSLPNFLWMSSNQSTLFLTRMCTLTWVWKIASRSSDPLGLQVQSLCLNKCTSGVRSLVSYNIMFFDQLISHMELNNIGWGVSGHYLAWWAVDSNSDVTQVIITGA